MAVHVSAGEGARAHSCIDALPAALASEVTHLFVAAWRKASLDLAPERLASYGLKYSSLRCLAFAHRTRGSLEPLRPTPAACAKQLICATAATLRALSIDAPNGFEAGDAVDIMCSSQLGARLHTLSLLLVPSFMPAALEEELPQGGRLQGGDAEQPSGEVPVEVHLLDAQCSMPNAQCPNPSPNPNPSPSPSPNPNPNQVHLLDDEEQLEFLRWRRDHEVMEEAQGAGYAMETDYLRNCVDGLCVSLREPPRVFCHRPPMALGADALRPMPPMPNAQCPQCPMPNAQCPMPNAPNAPMPQCSNAPNAPMPIAPNDPNAPIPSAPNA